MPGAKGSSGAVMENTPGPSATTGTLLSSPTANQVVGPPQAPLQGTGPETSNSAVPVQFGTQQLPTPGFGGGKGEAPAANVQALTMQKSPTQGTSLSIQDLFNNAQQQGFGAKGGGAK